VRLVVVGAAAFERDEIHERRLAQPVSRSTWKNWNRKRSVLCVGRKCAALASHRMCSAASSSTAAAACDRDAHRAAIWDSLGSVSPGAQPPIRSRSAASA